MTSVWDFSNPPFYWMISYALKMTCGETRENPVLGYARKNKGHTIVMQEFYDKGHTIVMQEFYEILLRS